MKGLNLAEMKKISQDEKSATFKHKDGHTIKIAIGSLSPKLKAELEKLPVHAAEGEDIRAPYFLQPNSTGPAADAMQSAGFAGAMPMPSNETEAAALRLMQQQEDYKQGKESLWNAPGVKSYPEAYSMASQEIKDKNNTGFVSEPQAQASSGGGGSGFIPPDAAQKAMEATGLVSQTGLAPQSAQPEAESASEPAARAPSGAAGPKDVPAGLMQGEPIPKSMDTVQIDPKQEMMSHAAAWQQDLQNGHIQPKTYQDLFHDKSTLGKIGTIFGLMIGGAGAGLTHQPNALLEMMNKQIDNDLNAQIKSKDNAVNYLRLNQQHEMNQAQIQQLAKQGHLTEAQAAASIQDSKIKAFGLSRMQMNIAAVHSLAQQVQKLPQGSPQRAQAENTLAMMYQALTNENSNIADKAVAAAALANFGSGNGQQPEQQFQQQNKMLRMSGNESMAKDREEKHIPGVGPQSSIPITHDDRNRVEAMNVLDNKVQDVLNFAEKHRGTVDPSVRAQAKQKAEELTAFYNKSVDNLGMTSGRMEWLEKQIKDNPTSIIQQVLGNNARLREIRDSNSGRRDLLMNKYGIKEYPKSQQPQSQTPVRGADGRNYIKSPDGKYMIPVK